MSEEKSRFVVSADWLQAELGKPDLRVLDASFYLPAQKRDADAEYAAGHIPGAIRFDQDKIADHAVPLPHTIPSPDYFAAEVGKLGVGENDRIVVYDGIGSGGCFASWAPRMSSCSTAALTAGRPRAGR
jgi:thiosulfate/3-mercaptopyruvate sulfurtransferase